MVFAGMGCYAETVVSDASRTAPTPPSLTDLEASVFMTAYGTSYHALVDRAALTEGETVVVLGAAGGVGIAAVQIRQAAGRQGGGGRLVGPQGPSSCWRRERTWRSATTATTWRAAIRDFTDGRGADVIYDPVGGAATEPAFRSLGWNGRLLVVGFAAGKIPKLPLNLPLLKSASAVGVFWGDLVERFPDQNRANVARLEQWWSRLIRPHVTRSIPSTKPPRPRLSGRPPGHGKGVFSS